LRLSALILSLVFVVFLGVACNDDGNGTPAPGDTIAPAAVVDLQASDPTDTEIDLDWTAPGDDNSTGTAATYDVRYSTATITAANWASATPATGEPTPRRRARQRASRSPGSSQEPSTSSP